MRAGDQQLNTEVGVNPLEPKRNAGDLLLTILRQIGDKVNYDKYTVERDEEINRLTLEGIPHVRELMRRDG